MPSFWQVLRNLLGIERVNVAPIVVFLWGFFFGGGGGGSVGVGVVFGTFL